MKKNITLLYVEDDIDQRKDYMFVLSARYLKVFEANNGQEGLALYKEHKPNLIITDIEMPLMNGLKMVEHIRKVDSKIPILILTGHVDNNYLLQAVNWNNIHFVSKADNQSNTLFENSLKKIEAFLDSNKINSIHELSKNTYFDILNSTLLINEYIIPLTYHESELLKLLCQKNNQVVTYETIHLVIWGEDREDKSSVRSLIRALNRKLQEKYIMNISGIGYKIIQK